MTTPRLSIAFHPLNSDGGEANGDGGKASTGKKSTGGKSRTQGEAFKRVQDEEWVGGLKKGFDDNTYEVCASVCSACRWT